MVGSTKNAHALIIARIETVNISLYLIFFAMVKFTIVQDRYHNTGLRSRNDLLLFAFLVFFDVIYKK